MARTRIAVKNLRVFGQRIPDGIFRQIADEMLPGPAPTANQLKNGAQSKAQVWAALCETDSSSRKKTVKRAQELMSQDAKTAAAKAGWLSPAEAPSADLDEKTLAELTEIMNPTGPTAIMLCNYCGDAATRVMSRRGVECYYCNRHDGNLPHIPAVFVRAYQAGQPGA